MVGKSQCRDLCNILPNCGFWSFFEQKSRAFTGRCHLVDIKTAVCENFGSENAYSCPFLLKFSYGFSQAVFRLP